MSMCTMRRFLGATGAFVTLAAATIASAQAPAPTEEQLPLCEPEVKPQAEEQAMPPCPPAEEKPTVVVMPPAPPPALPPAPAAAPAPAPAPARAERKHNIVFAPQTVSLATGAGAADYFGTGMSSTGGTSVGAAWDARMTFGTRSIIALEAGYIGSTNKFAGGGRVDSHGVDGTFRLQLPYRVQPYIFAGVGYNHMATDSEGNLAMNAQLRDSDHQFTAPAGGGLTAYVSRHFLLDVRGTYRIMPGQEILIVSDRNLHQWMAQGRIGYAF